MSLKSSDIDRIIDLITQIANALSKTDFLTPEEQQHLEDYRRYIVWRKKILHEPDGKLLDKIKDDTSYRRIINYDLSKSQTLEDKSLGARQEYIKSIVRPLQKKLNQHFVSWRDEMLHQTDQKQLSQEIEAFLPDGFLVKEFEYNNISASSLNTQKEEVVDELERIKANLEYKQAQVPAEIKRNTAPAKRIGVKKGICLFIIFLVLILAIFRILGWPEPIKAFKGIYSFIIFLAALLTSFHYLAWLGPIKEFIAKILWPK